MIVDAHHHIWDPAHGDYGWLTEGSPLHRIFDLDDHAAALHASAIDASILVQAAPAAAETDRLLASARASGGRMRGVVGWIDLAAEDAVRAIAARARDPLFVGVRPMLQDMAERDWILRPALAPALTAITGPGLVFDALVHHDQLATIATLAERHPALTIMLDHAGKPPLGASLDTWLSDINRLAALPNVACKLSGLATELPPGGDPAVLNECIDRLIALFAPDRLVWGSDWPVVTLSTSAQAWFDRCRDRVSRQGADADAIFGGNAVRIYRLSTE